MTVIENKSRTSSRNIKFFVETNFPQKHFLCRQNTVMWENLDAPQHWVSSPNKKAVGLVFVCPSPDIKSYCNPLAHDFKNYANQQELFLLSQLFLTFNLELIDPCSS